jgi:hypothetical protein
VKNERGKISPDLLSFHNFFDIFCVVIVDASSLHSLFIQIYFFFPQAIDRRINEEENYCYLMLFDHKQNIVIRTIV